MTEHLEPGAGPIRGPAYLPSAPDHVPCGRLPGEADSPLAVVEPGTTVTCDTAGHEGVLEDRGRDRAAFPGAHDVAQGDGEEVVDRLGERAGTSESFVPTGLGEDLDIATAHCVHAAVRR